MSTNLDDLVISVKMEIDESVRDVLEIIKTVTGKDGDIKLDFSKTEKKLKEVEKGIFGTSLTGIGKNISALIEIMSSNFKDIMDMLNVIKNSLGSSGTQINNKTIDFIIAQIKVIREDVKKNTDDLVKGVNGIVDALKVKLLVIDELVKSSDEMAGALKGIIDKINEVKDVGFNEHDRLILENIIPEIMLIPEGMTEEDRKELQSIKDKVMMLPNTSFNWGDRDTLNGIENTIKTMPARFGNIVKKWVETEIRKIYNLTNRIDNKVKDILSEFKTIKARMTTTNKEYIKAFETFKGDVKEDLQDCCQTIIGLLEGLDVKQDETMRILLGVTKLEDYISEIVPHLTSMLEGIFTIVDDFRGDTEKRLSEIYNDLIHFDTGVYRSFLEKLEPLLNHPMISGNQEEEDRWIAKVRGGSPFSEFMGEKPIGYFQGKPMSNFPSDEAAINLFKGLKTIFGMQQIFPTEKEFTEAIRGILRKNIGGVTNENQARIAKRLSESFGVPLGVTSSERGLEKFFSGMFGMSPFDEPETIKMKEAFLSSGEIVKSTLMKLGFNDVIDKVDEAKKEIIGKIDEKMTPPPKQFTNASYNEISTMIEDEKKLKESKLGG